MDLSRHAFINVIPAKVRYEAIFVTGYNLKLVYNTLNEKGCTVFPPEKLSYGHVWVYNDVTKECIAYSQTEFESLFQEI